jgi:hypothetical protein
MINDIITSVHIIIAFSICMAMIMVSGNLQNIQDNWGEYRCNPAMIPLAGTIGPPGTTTSDNISFCMQSTMASLAPGILKPFAYLQSKTTGMMAGIANSLADAKQQNEGMKFRSASMFSSIYSMFSNILVTFNVVIIKILSAQGKTAGILTTLLHIMTTVQYTFESMWKGVPGKMIKALAT